MMCGSPTPVGETDNNEATEALCLEASGDGTLDDVQQLVLRNKDLTGIQCASKLTHLTVLSLSHNRLTSVASLGARIHTAAPHTRRKRPASARA